MVAYIGKKIREEAYNCKFCSTLQEHIEKCILRDKDKLELKVIKRDYD